MRSISELIGLSHGPKWHARRLRFHLRRMALRVILRPKQTVSLVRFGSDHGGWWVARDSVGPGRVAYCAGVGVDISFDLALADQGCAVTSFDPTPVAVDYMSSQPELSDHVRFVPIGWWDRSDQIEFSVPLPGRVSYSGVNLYQTSGQIICPVHTVAELMVLLGDEHVDLIKMDIEGAEHRVIHTMVEHGPRPTTVCVEFDEPQGILSTISGVKQLRQMGYHLERIERFNYTFCRKGSISSQE